MKRKVSLMSPTHPPAAGRAAALAAVLAAARAAGLAAVVLAAGVVRDDCL